MNKIKVGYANLMGRNISLNDMKNKYSEIRIMRSFDEKRRIYRTCYKYSDGNFYSATDTFVKTGGKWVNTDGITKILWYKVALTDEKVITNINETINSNYTVSAIGKFKGRGSAHKVSRRELPTPISSTKLSRKIVRAQVRGGLLKPGHVRRLGVYQQKDVKTNPRIDARHHAMLPGYRVSGSGKLYFENRRNRSDTPNERGDYIAVKKSRDDGVGITKRRDKYLPIKCNVLPNTKKFRLDGVTYYPPKKTKLLSKDEFEKVIRAEMKKIQNKPIEHVFAIDDRGNILARGTGDYHSARGIDREHTTEKYPDRYIVEVHNHPADARNGWHGCPPTTFSLNDIRHARIHKIPEIRVAARGGKMFVLKFLDWSLVPDDDGIKRLYYKAMNYYSKSDDKEYMESYEKYGKSQQEGETKDEYKARVEKFNIADSWAECRCNDKGYNTVLNNYKRGKAIYYHSEDF